MIAFIKKIRAGDQQTKLKWLIIFSSISMAIVIVIWMMALRVITANIENPEPAGTTASIGSRIESALKELGSRTSTAIQNVKSSIKSNDIQLSPASTTNTNQ